MSDVKLSALVVSADEALISGIQTSLKQANVAIDAQQKSLTALNGQAAPMSARHDLIFFDLDETDEEAIDAVRKVCEARRKGAAVFALADDDLPLAKSRELTRAGVDQLIPRSALEEIAPSVANWQARRHAQLPAMWTGHQTLGKVIAVAQARGGVGTSTIAVNVADALQMKSGRFKGKRAKAKVAILDFDFQFGSVASQLDVPETDSLWRIAMDGTIPDAAYLDQVMQVSACGVHVLTAPSRFGPLNALQSDQVAAIIDVLKRSFDYIVIDMPSALVEWIDPILNAADRLLLATDVTVSSVRSARKLLDFYLAEHPTLEVEMVAVREKKPMFPSAHHNAASKLLEREFTHWIPDDPRPALEAIDRGRPVASLFPSSPLSKAIRRIARTTSIALPPRVNAVGVAR